MRNNIAFFMTCIFLAGCQIATFYGEDKKSLVDREGIRKVFFEHVKDIRNCYETFLQANEKSEAAKEGMVVIEFETTETGRAINPRTEEKRSTLRNRDLETCLHDHVGTWKFPNAPMGQLVNVKYPLAFRRD